MKTTEKHFIQSGRIKRTEQKNNLSAQDKNFENRAETAVMVLGTVAILLFFFFGAGTDGCERLSYSDYANAEYEGALPVYSAVQSESGTDKKQHAVLMDKGSNKYITDNVENKSANVEKQNKSSSSQNFWESFSNILEKFFRSRGLVKNEAK